MQNLKAEDKLLPVTDLSDIHCHIVPGVDDGAKTIEDSMAIIRSEYADGVRLIIATPHFRHGMFETDRGLVEERFRQLLMQTANEYPDLELYLGCEYHNCLEKTAEFRTQPLFLMPDRRHVLLELSEADSERDVRQSIYDCLAGGVKPVIAHAERILSMRNADRICDIRAMGARVQLNADSIIGREGWGVKRFCARLLKEGLVDFIGSDAHNMKDRVPHIGACALYLKKKFGDGCVDALMRNNPRKLLTSAGN